MIPHSIHYQRRWHYTAWIGLLLASLVALVLWVTPTSAGQASLSIRLRVSNAPAGCATQFWAGPKHNWPAANQQALLGQGGHPLSAQGEAIGTLNVRVAYRRWIGGVIPRETDDLLILKFQPKAGSPRYFALPLEMDWHTRLLQPGSKMVITAHTDWGDLWEDPSSIPKTHS